MTSDLVERLDRGDRRALPRLLTLVENDDPAGLAALDRLYPRTGQAHVIGLTGPPGSGKSTLVAALVAALRKRGQPVAVLAIDPTSPLTGGAVLGDRIRMMELHADPRVFVRSMAARGRVGGLAPTAARAIHLLDAAGYPTILLETVGTGQDGIDIAGLAQTVAILQVPGLGDGVQSIKAGQLEIGDLLIVNKADLPGAEDVARRLRQEVSARQPRDGWDVPVLPVVASQGEGIEAVVAAMTDHAAFLRTTSGWAERAHTSAMAEVLAGVRMELERRLSRDRDALAAALVDDVAHRRCSPERAIGEIVDRLAGVPGRAAAGDQGGG